jgi:hypothetical protein
MLIQNNILLQSWQSERPSLHFFHARVLFDLFSVSTRIGIFVWRVNNFFGLSEFLSNVKGEEV